MKGNQGSNYLIVLKGNQVNRVRFTTTSRYFYILGMTGLSSCWFVFRVLSRYSEHLSSPPQPQCSPSFLQQIVSTCYRLITILSTKETSVNNDPFPPEAYMLVALKFHSKISPPILLQGRNFYKCLWKISSD